MRFGFTTGSCSAAASKAAAYMLLSGKIKEKITVKTPKGLEYDADIVDIKRSEREVSCGVVKDGGDDPDITTGLVIYSAVKFSSSENGSINIYGGEGIGKVTKPGLDQPVGSAAINSVPRLMIERELRSITELFDFQGSLDVVISAPGGAEIAKKTFNPRLGVEGGISILGTSGIVEPMSTQAVLDTIRVELNQKKALGLKKIIISPGNYGMAFIKERLGFNLDSAVKCSNYIGASIDMAAELGFTDLLLCGHIGKLIKVSGGIMNTHSSEADCRMELMAACMIEAGADIYFLKRILDCVTADAAYEIIIEAGLDKEFADILMKKIAFYLEKRSKGKINIECITFSRINDFIAMTEQASNIVSAVGEEN